MRNEIVAGIGGLVVGHILWLIGITLATSAADVSFWVLMVAAASVLLAGVTGYLAWRSHQRKSRVWAAFLGGVPIAPVLFSLVVLGVTYL